MKFKMIAIMLTAVLGASPALAQSHMGLRAGLTRVAATADADKSFKRMDQNADGVIDLSEATAMLQARATKNGKTFRPQAATRFISRSDGNADGKVTLDEFRAAALARFDAADTNKNGTIDPDEGKAGPAGGDSAATDNNN